MVLEADGGGLAALQGHDLFQPGQEFAVVAGRPGIGPGLLRLRGHARQFLDQLRRQLHGAVVRPANLAQVRRRPFVMFPRFGSRQKFTNLRVGAHFMTQPRDQRHLLRAMCRAVARHVSALVPTQQAGARAEDGGFLPALDQFVVWGHVHLIERRRSCQLRNRRSWQLRLPQLAYRAAAAVDAQALARAKSSGGVGKPGNGGQAELAGHDRPVR